jgi:N-methylhydantoinase A
VRTLRHAGMRYRHQSYEVSVVAPPFATAADVALLAQRFHEAHHRRYGHMAETESVEIVNFAVTAIGALAKPALTKLPPGDGAPAAAVALRDVYFAAPAPLRVPIYRRAALAPGARLAGPAIIEEQTSTTVLYPGQDARVDEYLNIEIELR